jgi:glutathione S-transferase
MTSKTWAMGDAFTMADCAAAPALFYANLVEPFGDAYPHTAAYLDRLAKRPSFARVIDEAAFFMPFFPKGD